MIVEQISYELDWKAFKRGTSFFVPCLGGRKTKNEVRAYFARHKIDVVTKLVIENGIKGLRVWRM